MEKNLKDADLEKVTGGECNTAELVTCGRCHNSFSNTILVCPYCYPSRENNRTDDPNNPNNGIAPASK